MGDKIIFEGFAAGYDEEVLQPLTGNFAIKEPAAAIMPEGIPDIWRKNFNDPDALDALEEFIHIQESEFRIEVGPVDEAALVATPMPAVKGSPRFPGHLTISPFQKRNSVMQEADALTTPTIEKTGQLMPLPRLFSGGKSRRSSISSFKPMQHRESPLKKPLFLTGEDATGSDEDETQESHSYYQDGSDDDTAAPKDTRTDQNHTKALALAEEERLTSLLSQIKLEEEKLESLKEEVQQQQQIKIAVEKEARKLQEAVVEEQRISKETQDRLLEDERAKQAEEIQDFKARLHAAESARMETERELRIQIQRTREAEEQAARDHATAETAERRLQAQEQVALDQAAAEATRIEAARAEATRIEATRSEAARVEAARIEAARAEAARIEAARAEATRVEAARIEAAGIEAARIEVARIKSARIEAARVEAAAEAARIEEERRLQAQEQAARDYAAAEAARVKAVTEAARIEEERLIQAQKEADLRRRLQESEDARIALRLQQEFDDQLTCGRKGRADYIVGKEDDDKMAARVSKELSALLRDMEPNDEREMAEAEARQKAQATAYETETAAYEQKNAEMEKQRARLQYASNLAIEARTRLQRDSYRTTQKSFCMPPTDIYTHKDPGSASAWPQYAPAVSANEPAHNQQHAQHHIRQQASTPAWFENATLHSLDHVLHPPTPAHPRDVAAQEHQDMSHQARGPHEDTESARYSNPAPVRQSSYARIPEERVRTSHGNVSSNAAQHKAAPVHRVLSAKQNPQASAPDDVSYISVSSTISSNTSLGSSDAEIGDNIHDGDLMPPYAEDSKAVRFGTGNRAVWSVSEAPYPLLPRHIRVPGAESGHLHFHTDTLHSRANVWMLNLSGKWDNVTDQWRTDWDHTSKDDMLAHPRYDDLYLTVSPSNMPNWITFGTFKNKLKDGTARKAKVTKEGNVLFPPRKTS